MLMLAVGGLFHENVLVKGFYSFLLTQLFHPKNSIVVGKFSNFNNA